MSALKLFASLSKAFHVSGNKVEDIRLTEDGVIAEINLDGQDVIVFVTPKHLINKETSEEVKEELFY